MTIGIYALYWKEQDLIYVGQSQNIENRYKEHLRNGSLNKHSNYKVQDAITKYGNPELVILEECVLELLNELEIYWTNEFDSINKGLNIIEAGQVGFGTNSNNSKYTKLQILLVFRALTRATSQYISYTKLASILKVHKSLLQDICKGDSHLWLKYLYPKLYHRMIAYSLYRQTHNTGSTLKEKKGSVSVVSPNGVVYIINSISEFVVQNNNMLPISSNRSLERGFARVIDGTRKTYYGWKLFRE